MVFWFICILHPHDISSNSNSFFQLNVAKLYWKYHNFQYWEFYKMYQSFDEKVANVSLAFELMMDGGLPQPKVTDIDGDKKW